MIDNIRNLRYNNFATYHGYFNRGKGHTMPYSVVSHFPFRGKHDMWQYRETHERGATPERGWHFYMVVIK